MDRLNLDIQYTDIHFIDFFLPDVVIALSKIYTTAIDKNKYIFYSFYNYGAVFNCFQARG